MYLLDMYLQFTGLMSSWVSVNSLEGASLALVHHPYICYHNKNTLWGRYLVTSSILTSHLFLLGWLKLNLTLLLDLLRLT